MRPKELPRRGGPRKEHREISKEFSRQLLREYEIGTTYRELATKYEMAPGPIRDRCDRARDERLIDANRTTTRG